MKKFFISAFIAFATTSSFAGQIMSVTVSKDSAAVCDSVVITVSGTHTCPNDYVTGVSHSVSGSYININVTVSTGICIPPMTPPTFVSYYTLHLTNVSIGNYTVRGYYNSQLSSSTAQLNVKKCCAAEADAGHDTSLCDVSSYILTGNTPPMGATAGWTVISGGGSLSSATAPNATLSNMGYGNNIVVWSMADTGCSTTDTLVITNDMSASPAVAEADKKACVDTTTIHATAPTVGSGHWKALGLGAIISNPNASITSVSFIAPGTYQFDWSVTNGSCKNRDTLSVSYEVLSAAPVITEASHILTSTSAPQYQWYLDNNPIPGAVNISHTAVANGIYKVLASVAGCSNGLFSNEILISNVGIEEGSSVSDFVIGPNPANGVVRINGLPDNALITVYGCDLKVVAEFKARGKVAEIDCSDMQPGLYLVHLKTAEGMHSRKLIIR